MWLPPRPGARPVPGDGTDCHGQSALQVPVAGAGEAQTAQHLPLEPARLLDAAQEELEPPLPIALVANRLKPLVILASIAPEEMAQVEQRTRHHALLTHEERDQQAADAAIAVEEGVAGLELSMNQSSPQQDRISRSCMNRSRLPRA